MRFLLIATIFLMGCHPYKVTITSKGTGVNGELYMRAQNDKYKFDLKFNESDWENTEIDDVILLNRKTLEPLKQIKQREIYIE